MCNNYGRSSGREHGDNSLCAIIMDVAVVVSIGKIPYVQSLLA